MGDAFVDHARLRIAGVRSHRCSMRDGRSIWSSMAVMSTRADPEDEAALVAYATALADAIEAALPRWVERCVARFVPLDISSSTDAVAEVAGRVQRDVGAEMRSLLATDIDEQRTSPLALLRGAVREPTALLREMGVPPVVRDEFDERNFPDDTYGLVPASFADVDPALHEPGMRWGAAKAYVFKQRRKREGRR